MYLNSATYVVLLIFPEIVQCTGFSGEPQLPLVVNTWGGSFKQATVRAWNVLNNGEDFRFEDDVLLDSIEQGCNICEDIRCGGSVGYGGHPDSSGEVTLDAMIMSGPRHLVGAVGYLQRVKNAISVARAVMEHTAHTFLAGEGATAFATMMGFDVESLSTEASQIAHENWKSQDMCQPNYYRDLIGAQDSCPPYPAPTEQPLPLSGFVTEGVIQVGPGEGEENESGGIDSAEKQTRPRLGMEAREERDDPARLLVSATNHDTIGMVVAGSGGNLACGTTTNGAANKVAGRVGDSPVAGAGCYVDNDVGGAAATGDGDVMMRFLPSFRAVESMRMGSSPADACTEALCAIARFYPTFQGALVCVNKEGHHGAARHGLGTFSYSFQYPGMEGVQTGHAVDAVEGVCSAVRWS
ncbi:unnamed protein product [Choristocarpus tenellus]